MKGLTTLAATVGLIAGVSLANAQMGTAGAGAPGQDQRPQAGSATGPSGNLGGAKTLDAPPSGGGTSTSGAGSAPVPRGTLTRPGEPTNSMDRSVGDRDSRGTPKNAPR